MAVPLDSYLESANTAYFYCYDAMGALTEQFGMRLGGFVATGPRSAFPLHLITATEVVGKRLAIIGNAANQDNREQRCHYFEIFHLGPLR